MAEPAVNKIKYSRHFVHTLLSKAHLQENVGI